MLAQKMISTVRRSSPDGRNSRSCRDWTRHGSGLIRTGVMDGPVPRVEAALPACHVDFARGLLDPCRPVAGQHLNQLVRLYVCSTIRRKMSYPGPAWMVSATKSADISSYASLDNLHPCSPGCKTLQSF